MAANNISRFVIGLPWDDENNPRTDENDSNDARTAFSLAITLAKKDSNFFWVVADSKNSIEHHSALASILGTVRLAHLASGKQLVLDGDVRCIFGTPRSNNWHPSGIALVLYPQADVMDRLHGLSQITSIVVLPFRDKPLMKWANISGATQVIAGAIKELPPLMIQDSAVREAVVQMITMFKGTGHPSDQERIRERFAALRRTHTIEPEAIRATVLRQSGWGVSQADDLVKIAVGRQRATTRQP